MQEIHPAKTARATAELVKLIEDRGDRANSRDDSRNARFKAHAVVGPQRTLQPVQHQEKTSEFHVVAGRTKFAMVPVEKGVKSRAIPDAFNPRLRLRSPKPATAQVPD
jgi:hypothetical protein